MGRMIRSRPDSQSADDSGVYDIEDVSALAPPLPGEVIVTETVDRLIDMLAAELVAQAMFSMRTSGEFHIALSGGSTPQPLYDRLMYDPNYRQFPWEQTHIWIVDERCVEWDDAQSNFGMIRETIVVHSGIPMSHVHPIKATLPDAADDYESQLRETLECRARGSDRLDFVLLGMGADGHTASLFPHNEVLRETKRLVCAVEAPHAQPPQRITMTYPLINAARTVAVVVTGEKKAATLDRVAIGREPIDELPIRGVAPLDGELKWFLDAAACGGR